MSIGTVALPSLAGAVHHGEATRLLDAVSRRGSSSRRKLSSAAFKAAQARALKEVLRELWTRDSLDEALALWKRWDAWAKRSRKEHSHFDTAVACRSAPDRLTAALSANVDQDTSNPYFRK